MENNSVDPEISCLIGSNNLKLYFFETCWRGCLTLKQAWLSRIGKSEFA
jgi:hypothetical protein